MKKYIAFLLFTIMLCQINAQRHEIGVFVGGANGITDIGRTDYVNPLLKKVKGESLSIPLNLGVIYRYNLNPQQSLRANLNYAKFFGYDRLAKEDYRRVRELSYSQSLYEASVLFEYNFFAINSEQKTAHSPYIFAGLGVFGYDHPLYSINNVVDPNSPNGFNPEVTNRGEELRFSYTIPFGAGYKYKFNYKWILGFEVGFRPTFVDDLDKGYARRADFTIQGGEGINEDLLNNSNEGIIADHQVGDRSNTDWYVFTGFTLTYNFGRLPCFCD